MSLGFSYLRSCHRQTAIKILSDLGDIHFSWYIALARISSEVLNKIVKVSIVVLFSILEEMLWAFYHWVWCKLWACHIWALLHHVHFFYNLICSEFLLWKVVDFCQMLFLYLLIFILYFVNEVYQAYWFANIELSLKAGNNSQLIMMYNPFKCAIEFSLLVFCWVFTSVLMRDLGL